MSLNHFLRKRLLVVVAHQDDESLYFGGLLSCIAGQAQIGLISATTPMPGRADTHFRLANFYRVGKLLGCREVKCLELSDCGPRGEAYSPAALADEIAASLAVVADGYDVVLTHNSLGEPNKVYGALGHQAHKATHLGVAAALRQPIIVSGVGNDKGSFEIEYDRSKKRRCSTAIPLGGLPFTTILHTTRNATHLSGWRPDDVRHD
jgi:LmbE family N-acetylglucosaminyl deacetylase